MRHTEDMPQREREVRTEETQTAKDPDAISEELYAAMAGLGRRREQKVTTASASGEEGLLHYLAYKHDGVYSGVLKEQLGVGSGRMADILRRLEEKELIVRSEDAKDSRRVVVHITELGREHAVSMNRRVLAWYGRLHDYLGKEDSRELIRLLKKLSEFQG